MLIEKDAWEAVAEYEDGTRIQKYFPYNENGNSRKEDEQQWELENWLLTRKDGCTFYSVSYVSCYNPDDEYEE